MVIAFYSNEMNLRGIVNSTYLYAINNVKILKNRSIIFYNKKNKSNKTEVIKKFKEKFLTIGISNFKEIENYKKKLKINFIYTQKGGEKDNWNSINIKTLVHAIYPQRLSEIHGFNYAYISEWNSDKFSNYKVPYIPLIIERNDTKSNLRKKLNIKKNQIVLGCYGGSSSFDLKFVYDALLHILKKRNDITFLFLNIDKFCKHKKIKFLKGTLNENYKKKFINTCDAMIYGRSLGESFGLACGEFATENKLIISYKFNRHRSHIYNISKNGILEYGSYKDLNKILMSLNSSVRKQKTKSKYQNYTKKRVMGDFKKIFLKKRNIVKLSFADYLLNFYSRLEKNYFYIRHKIYNHYYNLIESKFY